ETARRQRGRGYGSHGGGSVHTSQRSGNEDLTGSSKPSRNDMRIFGDFSEFRAAVGTEIGASEWVEITQDRINRFADATCDEQWIHVDQDRAKTELPGGRT